MSSNTSLRPPTHLQEEPLQYTGTYSQPSRDTALDPTDEGLSGYTTDTSRAQGSTPFLRFQSQVGYSARTKAEEDTHVKVEQRFKIKPEPNEEEGILSSIGRVPRTALSMGSPQNTFSEAGGSRSGWHDAPAASTLGKSVKVKADPDAIDQGLEWTVESTQREVKTESHQVKTEGNPDEMSFSNVLPNFRAAAPATPLCQLTWWSDDNPNPTFSVSEEDLTTLGLSLRSADAGTRDLGLFARTVTAGEPPAVLVKIDGFWSVYLPQKRSAWSLQGKCARVHWTDQISSMDNITEMVPSAPKEAVKRLARRLYKGVAKISRQDNRNNEGVARAATRLTLIALSATDLSTAHLTEEVNCDDLTFEVHSHGRVLRNGMWSGLSDLCINHLSHCRGEIKRSCDEAHLSQRG